MTTEVLVVIVSLIKLSLILVNSTRYDLIMPLSIIGDCQVTRIDVELTLRAVMFNGALGAEKM